MHGDTNSVNDSVGSLDIDWVVGKFSEGLFSDDGIVDEVLSESTLVGKRLSSDVGEVGGSAGRGGNISVDNVGSASIRIEWPEVLFVGLDSRVHRSEDGERSRTGDFVGDSGRLEASDEKVKVIVSLKIGFFLSDSNSIGTPDLSWSLESTKDVHDGSRRRRGGRSSSGRSRGSGGGSSGSGRGGGGRGGSSRCATVTHLQVFLERRSSRDTLALVFVFESIRITGIGHTSGSDDRSVEKSGGNTSLLGRGEGGSSSNEGGNKSNFALWSSIKRTNTDEMLSNCD